MTLKVVTVWDVFMENVIRKSDWRTVHLRIYTFLQLYFDCFFQELKRSCQGNPQKMI